MENKYEIRKARKVLPPIDLLPPIPHKGRMLDVAVFGPESYRNNLEAISKEYSHPKKLSKISFHLATTSESISIAKFGFGNKGEYDAKRDIFDPNWLQANYIVRTQDGVFANTKLTDESQLKQLLNKCEKVNGIYLGENDLGFAPYETFETGVQDCDTFTQGGLARVLEHTKKKIAENLRAIASPKFYKREVNVWGFGKVREPILRLAALYSVRGLGGRLVVGTSGEGSDESYGFGVVPAKSE